MQEMASQVVSGSVFLRLMSASVAVANHAGNIVRDIMKKGNLGIVDKVWMKISLLFKKIVWLVFIYIKT